MRTGRCAWSAGSGDWLVVDVVSSPNNEEGRGVMMLLLCPVDWQGTNSQRTGFPLSLPGFLMTARSWRKSSLNEEAASPWCTKVTRVSIFSIGPLELGATIRLIGSSGLRRCLLLEEDR